MIPPEAPVGVVGGGSIGLAWAIVFARAGRRVRLFEPTPERRSALPGELAARLEDLAAHDLLGAGEDAVAGRIDLHETLREALSGCAYVQENAPENLALKQALFRDMEAAAEPDAILASSSSAIPASRFAGELATRERCLVVHPGNPPTLIPVAEVVPAPFTRAEVARAAEDLLASCGMRPVRVAREVEGFVFNRLQGAVLREAYCLVRDGVIGVEDLDAVVREGLGLRWSVIGPFETADLNTRGGIEAHAERMGPAYARMGAERGQDDPWTPELVARVAAARRAALPLERWEERVRWRDRALMALVRARRVLPPSIPR